MSGIGPAAGGLAGGWSLGWVGGKVGQAVGERFGNPELGKRIGEVSGGVIGSFAGGFIGTRIGTPKGVNLSHLAEMKANGVKYSPNNVIATGRNSSGQVVFLERGNTNAGLAHIVEAHAEDFANIGVPEATIPDVVMQAVTQGKLVGYQGTAGTGRPIYEVIINGQPQRIAVTTGSNGFIVGANPAGSVK